MGGEYSTRMSPKAPRPPLPPQKERKPRFRNNKTAGDDPESPFRQWIRSIGIDDRLATMKFYGDGISESENVIMVSSLMDRFLAMIIVSHFGDPPSAKTLSAVFDHPGALATFSSKIDLCHAFDAINEDIKHDLDIVRKIRNEFCHAVHKKSFSDVDICRMCEKFRVGSNPLESEGKAAKIAVNALTKDMPAARAKFNVVSNSLFIYLYSGMFTKYEQRLEIEKNKAEINKRVVQRLEDFRAKMHAQAQAPDAPASPRPPLQ